MSTVLYHGDCLDVMPTLDADSVDAVVTDPPYHLTTEVPAGRLGGYQRSDADRARRRGGFMGKAWDGGDISSRPETWAEVLRVLKPGGHLLAFGGTRTYHRMTCAIEDAGFEIRDCLVWLYGSGFPKSLDVSKAIDKAAGAEREVTGRHVQSVQTRKLGNSLKGSTDGSLAWAHDLTAPSTDAAQQWDGWGTALKPACEPIVLARKPLAERTVAANVLRFGTGAINVDACRIGTNGETLHAGRPARDNIVLGAGLGISAGQHASGRWPSNVILSHSPGCGKTCEPDCAVALLDAQSGERRSAGDYPSAHVGTGNGTTYLPTKPQGGLYADTGGASRYFKTFAGESRFMYCAKAPTSERTLPDGTRSSHPTTKPLALMRYLITLITPPGGTVLDPFAGSGTTLVAAGDLGFDSIGIESDPGYCDIAEARIGPGCVRR